MSAPNRSKEDASLYQDIIIEGHEYDGIQEYDNPMPAWWLWIFLVTIVWSVFYIAALGVGFINGYEGRLASEERVVNELRLAAAVSAPVIDAELLAAAMNNPDQIELGKSTFARSCAACHAADGSGGIGASLIDDVWIHGDEPIAIYGIIRDGVTEKGMPSHSHFTEDQIAGLVAFIKTELH